MRRSFEAPVFICGTPLRVKNGCSNDQSARSALPPKRKTAGERLMLEAKRK